MKFYRLRSARVALTLGGMSIVLAACGGPSNSAATVSSTTSATKTSLGAISYGVLPATNDAPVIVAAHLGYYSQLGLNVTLKKFNGGPLLMQAVTAGAIDGGLSGAPPVIDALSGGVAVKIVNGPGTMMPASMDMNGLVVSKASGITTLKQLKGQTIAVQSLGGVGSLLLQQYILPSVGLTRADVHIQELPWSSMAAAFAAGKIAAGTPFTPFLQQILSTESGKVSVLADPAAFFPGKSFPLGINVFNSKDLTRLGSTTIKAFLAGTEKGVTFVQNHPNQARQIFATYVGLPPSAIQNAPFGQFVPTIDVHALQQVADGLFALKQTSTDVNVSSYIVSP